MIRTILRAMYSAFISIVLISTILAGWTAYAFFSDSSKSNEINDLIRDMYVSQKSIVIDIVDLSKLLIKDKSESIAKENNNLQVEPELQTNIDDDFELDGSLISDNEGDNPFGIVIKQSLPDVSENTLPQIIEEPLVNENNKSSMDEIEMEMDME